MEEEKFFSVKGMAEALSISEETVRRWIREQKIASFRAGKKILIPKNQINKIKEDRK